jgi:hypothetical protein
MAAARRLNRIPVLAAVCMGLVGGSVLVGCSSSVQPPSSEPAAREESLPASGAVVATIESADASDALRVHLDRWSVEFNRAAVGSDVGTAPLDAATAVPLDRHDIVTLSQFAIEPMDGGSLGHSRFRVDFEFWRGNPLSSSYPAEPLASSSTYDVARQGQRQQGQHQLQFCWRHRSRSAYRDAAHSTRSTGARTTKLTPSRTAAGTPNKGIEPTAQAPYHAKDA